MAVMKKLINIFVFVAATAMALVSCQKNEIENPADENKGYVYTFLIGDADASADDDSKAVIGDDCVEWTSGDQIGTFTKSDNAYSNVTLTDGVASFAVYSKGGLSVGDKLYFYYPYDSNAGTDKTAVSMSIPTDQDGEDDMPMVSLPFVVTEESATNTTAYAGEVRFANLGSVIEFNIYTETAEYASEVIKSVTFEADNALAGDFTFDLTSVDYSEAKRESTLAITGHEEKSVTSTLATPVTVPATKDAAAIVKMVVAPGSHAGNIVVTTDKATYTFPISTAKEFKRSVVKPLGLNLRENVRVENAPDVWTLVKSEAELVDGEYVIISKYDTEIEYAYLPSATSSSSPSYSTQTIFNPSNAEVVPTTDISQMVWNLAKESDGNWTITNNEDKYLYHTSSTTGLRVGSTKMTWEISGHTDNTEALCLKSTDEDSRYVGIYSAENWRTYNTIHANYKGSSELYFYYHGKIVAKPSVSVSDVTGVSARGVNDAVLTYNLVNPDGSELAVACDGEVVTAATLSEGVISYTVAENNTAESKEGTITLTYGEFVKEVKVSQNAAQFTSTLDEQVIILEAGAEASKSFTVTSDFDWDAALSENAGFTVSPASYVWEEDTDENPGKQSVKITASAANKSEEGTIVLGTVTFTSTTGQTLEVTVKQESSYVVEGAAEESLTFSDIYTVNTILEGVTVDAENFAVSFAKNNGGTNPQYYASSTSVRLYSKNTLTISSTKTIVNIELTFASGENSNAISTDVGTYSNGTWTGSANSVTFTVGGTSGHRRIATIKVYYLGGGSGETSELQERNLAFSAAAATATVGEDFTEPTLSGATDGVGYSSSNPAVAEVDSETGEVTLLTAGETIITAAAEADATYKAGEASYTLTVSAGGGSTDPDDSETVTTTYTFTTKSWGDSTNSWTSGKDGYQYTSGRGIQVSTGYSGANATCKTSLNKVSQVDISYCTNASKGEGSITITIDGVSKTFEVTKPASGGTTLKTATLDFSSELPTGTPKITVICSVNSVYINALTFTHTN